MDTKTILLVDDSQDMQDAAHAILNNPSYHLVSAFNGLEAMELLQKTPLVDLIILDYEMPGMNGVEFLRARSLNQDLMKIPVVMCTSFDESHPVFEQAKKNAWIKGFLKKPFCAEEVELHLNLIKLPNVR